MRNLLFLFLLFSFELIAQPTTEMARWQEQAQRVSIIRDQWGVPHISGKTDADAVFGLMYTQCEDDFRRVEANYIDAIGRMAEVEGADLLWHDLRARMFLDSVKAQQVYKTSPKWMKKLCDAFADGVNYYLYMNPEVKPRLITRFEPWMPLMFSEGSIGGNITVISTRGIRGFYEGYAVGYEYEEVDPLSIEPTGSNGFAISPSKSKSGNALFLINPHTSHYFRTEVHMMSEEGLNAYGAVTWGQFFIYQGFNEYCGWMHTSSYADTIDRYLESIVEKDGKMYYQHGVNLKPVVEEKVSLPYKEGNEIKTRDFIIYKTHHGPIVAKQDDQWIALSMMNRPLKALMQSYLRNKAKGYKDYVKVMKINANSSNNTVFADSKGNIAYWHGNFIPKRNPDFDWSGLIDGKDPRTDWNGLHTVKQIVQSVNPESGWVQNCNATPFTVAGESSPRKTDFPTYMAPDRENYRGINAVRVLSKRNSFNLQDLMDAANDPYLAYFDNAIPALVKDLETEGNSISDSRVKEAIGMLKNWDQGYGVESVETSIGIYWAEKMGQLSRGRRTADDRQLMTADWILKRTTPKERLEQMAAALDQLENDFGSWKTTWGAINRFQRNDGAIRQKFDDSKPSIPVGFTSSRYGSLASYGARRYPGTVKRYGTGGNSFVAVVEFGDKVVAKSIVSGGQSSDPNSPHFMDQAEKFCKGEFKDVNFYMEDIKKNKEKEYRPGKE
ncbi:MAG: penicillin acylase family protein [Bacteroidota bacterium]